MTEPEPAVEIKSLLANQTIDPVEQPTTTSFAKPSSQTPARPGSSSSHPAPTFTSVARPRETRPAAARYTHVAKVVQGPKANKVQRGLSQEKATALSQLRRLEQEERTLARQLEATLYRRHHVYSDLGVEQLYIHWQQQAQQQHEEKHAITCLLRDANAIVRELLNLLQHVESSASYIDTVQKTMTKAEAAITTVKQSQRETYDALLRDESALSRELQLQQQHFERWQARAIKATKPVNKTAASAVVVTQVVHDLPPEVAAYEEYLTKHGGRQGGWEVYDHRTYLRYWNKHGPERLETVIKRVAEALLGKTEDDVRRHHDWYIELLRLDEAKRAAVERWRQSKAETERQHRQELAELEKQQHAADRAARQKRQSKEEQRRQAQAAEVKAWQQTKDEEERHRQAQQATEAEQRRAALERQRRERQAEIKTHVAGYVEVKEQQRRQEEELARAASKQKRLAARELAARIEARNKDNIKRLQAKHQQEQQEQQALQLAQEKRLDKLRTKVLSQVRVERDTTRLTSLNAAARHRQADKSKPTGRMYVRAPPKLHVPSWRQGL
eukprot:m.64973 g.64973  ORF g.64973 m.64973 type:complete len:558 (-) comp14018_c0_seq1:235-1908(-)